MSEEKIKIICKNNKPIDIEVPRDYHPQYHLEFLKNSVRDALEKIYDPLDINLGNFEYHFRMTVANPKAIKIIKEHAQEIGEARFGKDWDLSNGACFNLDLVKIYLGALEHLIENRDPCKSIGKENYTNYNLVEQEYEGNYSHYNSERFPIVHVIKGSRILSDTTISKSYIGRFVDLLGQLNNDNAYAYLKKKEAPYNYRMGEINLLQREKVDPFVLLPNELTIPGQNMKDIISFLCPFLCSIKSMSTGYVGEY